MNSKQLGFSAEQFVARKLISDGFTILARNYQKSYGEIDLIAAKDDLLIFVEVKMRVQWLIDPTEVIGIYKQKKIATVAKEFLAKHNIIDKICRFDVALVSGTDPSWQLRYIDNAFCAQE